MAVSGSLILLALVTIGFVPALQPISEQQRLQHGRPPNPGNLVDAAFREFVLQTMHAFHVPGLSLAVIDQGQICAEVIPVSRQMKARLC